MAPTSDEVIKNKPLDHEQDDAIGAARQIMSMLQATGTTSGEFALDMAPKPGTSFRPGFSDDIKKEVARCYPNITIAFRTVKSKAEPASKTAVGDGNSAHDNSSDGVSTKNDSVIGASANDDSINSASPHNESVHGT